MVVSYAMQQKKIGSDTIDENTIKKVSEFYYNETISRACPGIREYVIKHNANGENEKVQRRLILMNIREAYLLFKEKFKCDLSVKIGFSKFATLRPKECILAGSAHGIHTTCVCVYHQNVKFIFESSKSSYPTIFHDFETYRDLLSMLQCANSQNKCKLNECEKCPGVKNQN